MLNRPFGWGKPAVSPPTAAEEQPVLVFSAAAPRKWCTIWTHPIFFVYSAVAAELNCGLCARLQGTHLSQETAFILEAERQRRFANPNPSK